MKSENVAIQFTNDQVANLGKHIHACAVRGLPLVVRNSHRDAPGAVICGLAPSLKTPTAMRAIRRYVNLGWLIFGIKEAIAYLNDRGIQVHYSVNMDPGAQEVKRVPIYPDVTYCLASSCHPELFDHILCNGGTVRVYHSACGWQNEVYLYKHLFGNGDTIIGGFTVANRALGLAEYMGIPRTVLVGCDFGWRENGAYYADFVKANRLQDVDMTDGGKIDGKPWWSRPDLLASAVSVARLIKTGQARVIGDSLAASLAKRSDEYLDEVCKISKPGKKEPVPL